MTELVRGLVFGGVESQGFSNVLKARIEAYFRTQKISKHANALMVVKTLFYLTGFIGLYFCVVLGDRGFPLVLLLMMTMGFFLTGVGFNIAHDGAHGAYSSDRRVNHLVSHAFELIGGSSYTWKIRHNLLHHTYTNIIGADGDLESMPLLRFCLKPGRQWYHRFQHIYAPILYGFVTLVWVLKKDYIHIFEERATKVNNHTPPWSAYVTLFFFKALHYTLFLIIPYFVLHWPLWQVAIGFMAMHFVAGVMMAFVFQLGHCVSGPQIDSVPTSKRIPDSWAEHQLKTSSNFGGGFLTNWVCGGLNYQIEHHLFPRICHVHYPAISLFVRQTAAEFDLPYHSHKNIWTGIASHLQMLKYLGRTDPT